MRWSLGFYFFVCFVCLGCLEDKGVGDPVFEPQPGRSRPTSDARPPPPDQGNEPADPETWRLRVATWNVRRFFDSRCDSGRCGPGDYEEAPSPARFTERAAELAEGIEAMDLDVIALQEVESRAALDGLLAMLDPAWGVAEIGEVGFPGSVDVVILAKGRLDQRINHRQAPIPLADGSGTTRFARELLELRLTVRGAKVIVFAAHFKSKANDDPERRLAEGMATHEIMSQVAAQNPDAVVVLGGDLNDSPGSPALEAMEADGKLLRVASDVPESEAWTLRYRGIGTFIDHLFLGGIGGVYLPGSTVVHRGAFASGYGGSDHAAVSATFRLSGR